MKCIRLLQVSLFLLLCCRISTAAQRRPAYRTLADRYYKPTLSDQSKVISMDELLSRLDFNLVRLCYTDQAWQSIEDAINTYYSDNFSLDPSLGWSQVMMDEFSKSNLLNEIGMPQLNETVFNFSKRMQFAITVDIARQPCNLAHEFDLCKEPLADPRSPEARKVIAIPSIPSRQVRLVDPLVDPYSPDSREVIAILSHQYTRMEKRFNGERK